MESTNSAKVKIYWLGQIGGWTLWTLKEELKCVDCLIAQLSHIEGLQKLFTTIVLWIFATHAFRNFLKRMHWIQLSISQMIIHVSISMGFLVLVLVFLRFYFLNKLLGGILLLSFLWEITDVLPPLLIWTCVYVLYQYLEQQQQNIVKNLQLQTLMHETEARILRGQLNPHFIFNSLNSIRALIFYEPEKAEQSITKLANLFRSALVADREQLITIEHEIETVRNYISLEKIRYEDRLIWKESIDKKLLDSKIPPMMLQTLVENSIKHGIQNRMTSGEVTVQIFEEHSLIRVIILNNGTLNIEKVKESKGVGLQNTRKRLKLFFGEKAQMTIFQKKNDIVCTQLILPNLK